jgi:hypothetical protein
MTAAAKIRLILRVKGQLMISDQAAGNPLRTPRVFSVAAAC